jgi:hypothetical protein
MPTLTVEAIRENPWNVMTHDIPFSPALILLSSAYLAATCYRRILAEMLDDSRADLSLPPPPEMSETVSRLSRADQKIVEICARFEKEYDISAREFLFSTN